GRRRGAPRLRRRKATETITRVKTIASSAATTFVGSWSTSRFSPNRRLTTERCQLEAEVVPDHRHREIEAVRGQAEGHSRSGDRGPAPGGDLPIALGCVERLQQPVQVWPAPLEQALQVFGAGAIFRVVIVIAGGDQGDQLGSRGPDRLRRRRG